MDKITVTAIVRRKDLLVLMLLVLSSTLTTAKAKGEGCGRSGPSMKVRIFGFKASSSAGPFWTLGLDKIAILH